jgi:hypothetical protein
MPVKQTNPREDIRSEPVRDRHEARDVYDDKDAADIAAVSPEGAPANPKLGSSGIAKLIALSVLAVIVASLLAGVIISPAAGWGVFVVSMLLAVVINPVIYASVLRARERDYAAQNKA